MADTKYGSAAGELGDERAASMNRDQREGELRVSYVKESEEQCGKGVD